MKKYLLFIGIVCLISACAAKQGIGIWENSEVIASRVVTSQGDTVISCKVADVQGTFILPLSALVDSLEVIKLDDRDDALIGNAAVTMSAHYIGMRYAGSPYKLFTRQGQFIGYIGSVGQGPGEYVNLYDSQIDEQHDRIYLLPWPDRRIIVYDLKGNYVGDIPLSYSMNKGAIWVDTKRQRVCVTQMAFTDVSDPAVWVQDFEGNVIHQQEAVQIKVAPDFSNEFCISYRAGNLVSFALMEYWSADASDTLYHYFPTDNKLQPALSVEREEPDGYGAILHEYPRFYVIDLVGESTIPGYTSMVVKEIVVHKETLRGGYYRLRNDMLGGISLGGYLMETGYVANVEPGVLLEAIEKRLGEEDLSDKDREFLEKWEESISEDDNNYIIYGKYK